MQSQSSLVLFIHHLSYFAPTIFRILPKNELATIQLPWWCKSRVICKPAGPNLQFRCSFYVCFQNLSNLLVHLNFQYMSTPSPHALTPSHSLHPSSRHQTRTAPFVCKVLEIGGEKMNSKNISDFEKGDSEEMCSCQQLWYFQSNSHPVFSLP